jgi:hypothetical protein
MLTEKNSGEIASHLSENYDVVSVDVTDQRTVYDGFTFVHLDSEESLFSDKSFDLVVSKHVIGKQEILLF